MSGETTTIMPEEEGNAGSNMNFRLLLLSGLAVYIAVTFIAWLFRPGPEEIPDEEWLGRGVDRLVDYFGEPAEVEDDGQGGRILRYRRLLSIDHHYSVERFEVFVDPSGNVSDIKREPTRE